MSRCDANAAVMTAAATLEMVKTRRGENRSGNAEKLLTSAPTTKPICTLDVSAAT